MTTPMKRRHQSKLDPRVLRAFPSDWVVFWLAGPGPEGWERWKQHYFHNPPAFALLEGSEQEDAESRGRVLALMKNLFRLDQISKQRKTLRTRQEIAALSTTINAALRLYPVRPYVGLQDSQPGWGWGQIPLPVKSVGRRAIRISDQERAALAYLEVNCKIESGWPPQLRRCAICNNWFWGKKAWSKYCAVEACKAKGKQQYQTSEAYRKRRARNYKHATRFHGVLTPTKNRKEKR
jgi:hypothetical protein